MSTSFLKYLQDSVKGEEKISSWNQSTNLNRLITHLQGHILNVFYIE